MYQSLYSVGLKSYLDEYFFNREYLQEPWLTKIDKFVGNLSDVQQSVLREKFKPNITHLSANDLVNEVMIACVHHPTADFIREATDRKTFDLFDESFNLKIEVKTLNESEGEQIRHNNQKPNEGRVNIGKCLSGKELEDRKKSIIISLQKKCLDKLSKAVCQLESKGKIYLIYDYDILFGTSEGSRTHAPMSGEEVGKIVKDYCTQFLTGYPDVAIEVTCLEDLRARVANCKLT